MLQPLLNVPHHPQIDETGCLLACIEMVTDFIGRRQSQQDLARLLGLSIGGVPGSRVKRLEPLGFQVTYNIDATFDDLVELLQRGIPVIVLFRTVALEYWQLETDHAAVVIGIDNTTIYLNDPAFERASQTCSRTAFEFAWSELDNRFAVITL